MRIPPLLAIFCVGSLVSTGKSQEFGAMINKSGAAITGVTFRVWSPNALQVSVRKEISVPIDGVGKFLRLKVGGS